MTVESSLNYQNNFFKAFAKAWADRSTYRLYQGIDDTSETLRLALTETPGYILAYDKGAERELHDFLRQDFIAFLRQHIPFFEVSDQGDVFFGDWYHRRQFGVIDVFARGIVQRTDAERDILPQLRAFAEDPDHFLDHQLEALRKDTYQEVDRLHRQIEDAEADAASTVATQPEAPASRVRGFLKSFVDPDQEQSSTPPRKAGTIDPSQLKARFDSAKAAADEAFDAQKRQLQVAAAITRYEYQAVLATYSSVEQFENILSSLQADFMRALELKEEQANA
ncbi:SbcC family exonuclease [Lacticaseibacillus jixianensis]|uniref:SbcC family exonuclease n=1 Tax=Lacticaseibacillus jixianensis TaxID=2486012 RepID=A0ABW4B6P8_9LACO|nr:SbcC family exonuclease [Lacticaseibacillus jixianensis]